MQSSPLPPIEKRIWRWERLVSPRWREEWLERLRFVGEERLVWIESPGKKLLRVQAYPRSEAMARQLKKNFGGVLHHVRASSWLDTGKHRPAIHLGKHLTIISAPEQRATITTPAVLCIPAGMAFGTGEHATTGLLLRWLTRWQDWPQTTLLDLGTGSGILALAARALGCASVSGMDFDPVAIAVARNNERLNFSRNRIAWSITDVRQWHPQRQWRIVTANLFSDLLITCSPTIWQAVQADGCLLTSGILRSQEEAVCRAFVQCGAHLEERRARGKWVVLAWSKPA